MRDTIVVHRARVGYGRSNRSPFAFAIGLLAGIFEDGGNYLPPEDAVLRHGARDPY